MEITIKKKEDNKLLHRKEVEGEITFTAATPSNQELAEALAKELNVNVNLVVMKNIYTEFSVRKATFQAVAYESAEMKDKFEMSTKHLRKKAEEDTKKKAEEAAAKAEEEKKKAEEAKAAEEAPAEEPAKEEEKAELAEEPKTEEPVKEEAAPVEKNADEASAEEKTESTEAPEEKQGE